MYKAVKVTVFDKLKGTEITAGTRETNCSDHSPVPPQTCCLSKKENLIKNRIFVIFNEITEGVKGGPEQPVPMGTDKINLKQYFFFI